MNKIVTKKFKVNRKKQKALFNEFLKVYKKRPIKNNEGGMDLINLFNLFIVIKILKPKLIVESGVYKGLSSWFILKAAPKNAKIFCLDINLSQLQYRSSKIYYLEKDFKNLNFYNLPKKTLLVLDDHQNHLLRLKQSVLFGFSHIFLDDDSDASNHDFYTLKHVIKKRKFNHKLKLNSMVKTTLIFFDLIFRKLLGKFNSYEKLNSRLRDSGFDIADHSFLKKYVEEIFYFDENINFFRNYYKRSFNDPRKNGSFQTLIKLKND